MLLHHSLDILYSALTRGSAAIVVFEQLEMVPQFFSMLPVYGFRQTQELTALSIVIHLNSKELLLTAHDKDKPFSKLFQSSGAMRRAFEGLCDALKVC